jgi:hypothetical protein
VRTENVWHGQHGAVILGPTEARVARYLDDLTRHGLVTVRTAELADRLRLERSEAYRVLARMRALGLFGIEDDRSGSRGGRRVWRTGRPRAESGLDAGRHRIAWSRVVAWSRARRARLVAHHLRRTAPAHPGSGSPATSAAGVSPAPAAGGSFADMLRQYGAGGLLDAWGIT